MSLAGLVNSASAVYGLTNVAITLAGGKVFGLSRGYYPSEWGHSKAIEQAILLVPNIGGIFFDAIMSYEESNSVTYTSHPVQDGANISDHGYLNPVTVSMEVACSNTMACRQPGGCYPINTGNKTQDVVTTLLELMKLKQPIRLVGVRSALDNMVIESIDRHEDASTIDKVVLSIQLKQLRLVEVSSEKVSARNWSSAGNANKGEAQPATPASTMSGILGDGQTNMRGVSK